jgi:hypothetical protein
MAEIIARQPDDSSYDEIHRYLAADSPDAVDRVVAGIYHKIRYSFSKTIHGWGSWFPRRETPRQSTRDENACPRRRPLPNP